MIDFDEENMLPWIKEIRSAISKHLKGQSGDVGDENM